MTSPNHEEHAAALHACTRRFPQHPDSEEAVRVERQRVAQELEPFQRRTLPREASHTSSQQRDALSQTHQPSNTSSNASNAPLQERASLESHATTQPDLPRSRRSSIRELHWYSPVVKFWTTHVSLTIDEGAHRDHLALERTFLGYLRTSLILVMTGVIIAQLFRIQRALDPDPRIGFYVVGEPLSVAFIGMAIFLVFVGAIRYWRLQSALARGKALAGGWEILMIMVTSALLLIATFSLVVAINVDKAR